MMSEATADLTFIESPHSELRQMKMEFLAKLHDMSKAQALSYLILPGSESAVAVYDINRTGTIPFSRPDIDLVFSRPTVKLRERFISLQKWEGVVTGITSDSFFAKLVSLSSEDPDEEAEFAIKEISIGDIPLLQVGAVFYWNIGYHDSAGGQRTRGSIIRFRRLPAWTKREIEDARRRAAEIRDYLEWGEPERSSETRRD